MRDASRILVDAALAERANRFIQESFAPTYQARGEEWIDESVPLAPASYNKTVIDAERSAERFTESGGTGVILRFAGLYGPDAFTLRDMLRTVRRGYSPLPGAPAAYVSAVAHDDAATAVVAALGLPAGAYNVCDDEPVRRSQFGAILAQCVGAQPPHAMPGWMTALMGSMAEILGRSQRVSNRKLRTAAPGWVPEYRSVREGVPIAVKQMRA
jgi:nucleoside-diphosphate-sugar epimerase